jgi:hypothetical protein
MRQASWNLCPQAIQYSSVCYANPDVAFTAIAGSVSSQMPDLPDGDWSLVLKKDIFQKVAGAARLLSGSALIVRARWPFVSRLDAARANASAEDSCRHRWAPTWLAQASAAC